MKRIRTGLVVLGVCILLLYCGKGDEGSSLKHGIPEESKSVKGKYGIWLEEGTLCQDVVDRKPVNRAEEFYTDDSTKVFLYTRIGCEKPGLPIFHRWSVLREGLPKKGGLWEEMHSSQLWINSTNYRTWTYKTVFPGHWCVDVLAPDNKTIIKSFFFKVKGPKSGEQIDFDIQYDITQISLLESELCEKVEDNQPVNPTEVFNVAEDEWGAKVWIYMKLGCKAPPAKIYLRWNRWIKTIDGNDGWSPDVITMLAIKGESWRTRGFKTCQPGLWRLDILAPDGETIMKVFEFEVKKEQGELEQEKSET